MFVDQAKIYVKAGNGGNGAVSFHREKYVASGGPDGGDGGKGGNVIFRVDNNLSTLEGFRYKRKFIAQDGQNGGAKRCSGKSGEDLIVRVPRGTLVREVKTGRLLADLSGPEDVIIAYGGGGGAGNQHFATATRQIPRFAKPGKRGDEWELQLELKLLADVGLVGFPNVGKSTLISVVSAAKPTIANYHFTTLTPVLGVVRVDVNTSFVMADIPGLIEGASEGVGLGHAFLRHVERCRMIVHVVDVSGSEGRDPVEDFELINQELARFSEELAERPMLVAANKCDLAEPEQIEAFRKYVEAKGYEFLAISAAAAQGTSTLVEKVAARLQTLPPILVYETNPFTEAERQASGERYRSVEITFAEDAYEIKAPFLEDLLLSVNMDDYESLQYFQRVLRENGVIDRLEEMGVQEGDLVRIDDFEFEFVR